VSLPLEGRGILLTRPAGQNGEAAALLAKLGARTIELPLIAIAPPDDLSLVDAALADVASFDLVVFTSANAVRGLMDRAAALSLGPSSTSWPPAAAVGPKTAEAVGSAGLRIEALPGGDFQGAGLAALLAPKAAGRRILFPRAAKVGEVLPDALRAAGADLVEVVVYRTAAAPLPEGRIAQVLKEGRIEAILLGSPSAVRSLVEGLGGAAAAASALKGVALASIGPVTGRALLDAGLIPAVTTERFTMANLIAGLERHFRTITPND
jgi:uroporphyrinogen-III synthase